MKTSAYFRYQGPGRIGITRSAPRFQPPGYRLFRTLAPTRAMLGMGFDDFQREFDAMLNKLDPAATWDELHLLAGAAEPILLCYESAPFSPDNWCHRRLVAEWFKTTLGESVDEIGGGAVGVFGETRP